MWQQMDKSTIHAKLCSLNSDKMRAITLDTALFNAMFAAEYILTLQIDRMNVIALLNQNSTATGLHTAKFVLEKLSTSINCEGFEDKTLFMGKFSLARAAYNMHLFSSRKKQNVHLGSFSPTARSIQNERRMQYFLSDVSRLLEHTAVDIDFLRLMILMHHINEALQVKEETEIMNHFS